MSSAINNSLFQFDCKHIDDYQFYQSSETGRIVLPEGLISIGEYAFSQSSVNEITIPSSVRYIGRSAFSSCPDLKKITVNCSLGNEDNIFSDCPLLECCILKDMPNNTVFRNCPSISDISFSGDTYECSDHTVLNNSTAVFLLEKCPPEYVSPFNLSEISDGAASSNNALRSVVLQNISFIGNAAFSGCSELESVFLSKSIKHIGRGAFSNCRSLSEISIPSGIEFIPESTFENCVSLVNIHIPDSVSQIGASAFSGCSGLKCIHLPEDLSSIRSGTFAGTGFSSFNIPPSVHYIGRDAFMGCTDLAAVSFGSSTVIKETAFSNCSSLRLINRRIGNGNIVIAFSTFNSKYISQKINSLDKQISDPLYAVFRLLYPSHLQKSDAVRLHELLSIRLPDASEVKSLLPFAEQFAGPYSNKYTSFLHTLNL